MYGNTMRFPTNPNPFRTTTPTFLTVLASAIAVATTGLQVESPRTISTNRITFAGLKKCMPTTICAAAT